MMHCDAYRHERQRLCVSREPQTGAVNAKIYREKYFGDHWKHTAFGKVSFPFWLSCHTESKWIQESLRNPWCPDFSGCKTCKWHASDMQVAKHGWMQLNHGSRHIKTYQDYRQYQFGSMACCHDQKPTSIKHNKAVPWDPVEPTRDAWRISFIACRYVDMLDSVRNLRKTDGHFNIKAHVQCSG